MAPPTQLSGNRSHDEPATKSSTAPNRGSTAAEYRSDGDDILPRAFGRYELRSLLGRGGMGAVYLAYDPTLDRMVALKIPRPFAEEIHAWRDRFLAEARSAAVVQHPNICPVHEVGEIDGQPYLTMPFLEGETLAARLKQVGRLSVNESFGWMATLARAMGEAHQRGIVHRDLKPANIMIDRRGQPIIMDFGLAYRAAQSDDLRLTLSGVALGTPEYMPPEQAGGDYGSLGPPADVYSLGAILNEMVTGSVPFKAKSFGKLVAQIERDAPPSVRAANPEVDAAAESIIFRCLQKAPTDRFASGDELAHAIDDYIRGVRKVQSKANFVVAPSGESATAPYRIERKRSTWPIFAGGVVGLGIALMVLWSVVSGFGGNGGSSPIVPKEPGGNLLPIAAPVRSTVVNVPNWTILTDASKTETEAWIAELKEKNHSLMWLEVVAVDGKPFYSGVAAHDQRQPNWKAFLDITYEEINNVQALGQRIDAQRYVVNSLSGYPENGRLTFAVVFHEGLRPGAGIGCMQLDAMKGKIPDLLAKGMGPRLIRPISKGGNLTEVAALFEPSANTATLYGLNVTGEDLSNEFKTLREQNYYPYAVTPVAVNNELRFTYTFCDQSTPVDWRHELDWTAADFHKHAEDLSRLGYAPDSVTPYLWNGAIRYSSVWLKPRDEIAKVGAEKPAPQPALPVRMPASKKLIEIAGWTILADASLEELKTWIDEQRAAKRSLMWLDVVGVEEKPIFAALCAHDGRQKEWTALLDLTMEEINDVNKLELRVSSTDNLVASLSGYHASGQPVGVALFYPGKKPQCILGMGLVPILQPQMRQYTDNGYHAKLLRPFSMGGKLFNCTVYLEPSSHLQGLYGLNLTEANWKSSLDTLKKKKQYPLLVAPCEMNNELRITYTSSDAPSDKVWEHRLDLTSDALKAFAEDLSSKGYYPISLAPYTWNGEVRYSTVWLKDAAEAAAP